MSAFNKQDSVALQRAARRRAAYSLAAGATAAIAGSDAEAQIVWSGPQDIEIDQFASLLLDIEGDIGYGVTYDATLKNYVFGGGNYQGLVVNNAGGRAVGFVAGFPYVSAVSPGDVIDDAAVMDGVTSGSMAYGGSNPNAEFNDVQSAYIGLSFPINTFIHYGWIRVSVDNAAGTFTVHDWAYNSTTEDVLDESGNPILDAFGDPIQQGLPITVGQVAGDYNGDGVVDAADYTVYRDTLGSTEDLRADGDGDGEITAFGDPEVDDDGDYFVWAQDYNYSAFLPSTPPTEESTSIPEPATLGLLACGAAGLSLLRRTRSEGEARSPQSNR